MNIALIGAPGSGKTSIAEVLVKEYGYIRLSFAQGVKLEVAEMLAMFDDDITKLDLEPEAERTIIGRLIAFESYYMEQLTNPDTKERYRMLLQWWGTEWRREQNPNYWVEPLVRAIGEQSLQQDIVVDDCRFWNEYACLKSHGFLFVRLESGETTVDVGEHASEVDWKEFEYDLQLSYQTGVEEQAKRLIAAIAWEGIKNAR